MRTSSQQSGNNLQFLHWEHWFPDSDVTHVTMNVLKNECSNQTDEPASADAQNLGRGSRVELNLVQTDQ